MIQGRVQASATLFSAEDQGEAAHLRSCHSSISAEARSDMSVLGSLTVPLDKVFVYSRLL